MYDESVPKFDYLKKSRYATANFNRRGILQNLSVILILSLIYFLRAKTFDVLPESHIINRISPNQKVTISGIITSPPEIFKKKVRLYLESEELTIRSKTTMVSGKLRITVYEKDVLLKYGDRIKINNMRHRKTEFMNMFNKNTKIQKQKKNL